MLKRMSAQLLTLTSLVVLACSWNATPAVEAQVDRAVQAPAPVGDQSSGAADQPAAQAELNRQRAEIVDFVAQAYRGEAGADPDLALAGRYVLLVAHCFPQRCHRPG